MTPLKANTFISFILLFVLLLLSGGAASQRRRAKVAPPNIQRTDTLQVGDSLQMGDSLQGGKGLPADSLQQDTVAAAPPKKDALDAPVAYEANDSIVFTQSGFAHLYGQGKVSYPGDRSSKTGTPPTKPILSVITSRVKEVLSAMLSASRARDT